MKLMAPRIDGPATWREIHEIRHGARWPWCSRAADKRSRRRRRSPAAGGTNIDRISRKNDTGGSQNKMAVHRSIAMSGAPIISGTNRCRTADQRERADHEEIMIRPCMVVTVPVFIREEPAEQWSNS
ncbi:MAG: hypothetical protein R3C46_12320 [Hyphomonadaceae bacterium]